ncbi:hypothetical protein EVJ58_g7216 [Rhodofomes roseus]|uniref:DUF6533 domain-containing protein n=1 Tax=Rhodofomes roseus TaxID=34475 RepID=A0A4Y9Y6A0_9APHY|nr:hypothetical protein EVJ58_g7216 [Rhodofomes roseus]
MSASKIEQDTVSILQSVFIDNCFLVVAIALYVFDRCICAGREIDLIWSRGHSLVSALYALLEVLTVLYFGLLGAQNFTYLDCKFTSIEPRVPETIALQAITASYDAVIAIVAALRVYAINGRDSRLSVVVFMLLLLRSAYDVFEAVSRLYIVSIVTSIAADGIVFIVTWRRTYNVVRLSREANIEVSLSSLLLRDGMIYFASLFTVNCIIIATNWTTYGSLFNYLTLPISTVLLSRMLLNLREASLRANGASTSSHLGGSQSATMPDIDFARGVGAFGASWNDNEDAGVDEGEFEDDGGLELEVVGSETAEIVSAEA